MKTTEPKSSTSTALQRNSNAAPFFQPEESREEFFGSKKNQEPFFIPVQPVGSNLNPATIQAKLTVGAPDDMYKQEADVMAGKVVQQLTVGDNNIQRKPALLKLSNDASRKIQTKVFVNGKEWEPTKDGRAWLRTKVQNDTLRKHLWEILEPMLRDKTKDYQYENAGQLYSDLVQQYSETSPATGGTPVTTPATSTPAASKPTKDSGTATLGWKGVKKGVNTQEIKVGDKGQIAGEKEEGIRRLPIQIDDKRQAIVLIPSKLDPANSIEVLLHLHGHKSVYPQIGYAGSSLNEVRDVQYENIEQQLLASGHDQMIAILPQGSGKSEFEDVNTTTYVAAVFNALNNLGMWGKDENGNPIKVDTEKNKPEVILSAHSGGGANLSSLLEKGGKPANPGGMKGLFLFDSINARAIPKKNPDGTIAIDDKTKKPISSGNPDVNSSRELKRIRGFVAYQLELELTQLDSLTKLPDTTPDPNQDNIRQRQLQFLEENGFRVRGYYTPGWYEKIYAPLVKDINDWFKTTAKKKLPGLDQKIIDRWSQNYVIQSVNAVSKVGKVGEKGGHKGHLNIVGQGIEAGEDGKNYDPAKGGALQDALGSFNASP